MLPLTRISFLHDILPYVTADPNELVALRTVHSSWNECIMYYGEEIWKQIYSTYLFKDQSTLLHMSIKRTTPLMKLFLRFDINPENKCSKTPLHIACRRDRTECVQILLEKYPDTDTADTINKMTPLHYACDNNNPKCAKLLLEKGANKDTKDLNNRTPLHYACSNRYPRCVRLLLEMGADMEITDYCNMTPLHVACFYTATECVRLLLKHGANVNAVNSYGWTPLHYACRGGDIECVKLLLENRANIDARDRNNGTPLHKACFGNHIDCANLLLRSRSWPNADTLNSYESRLREINQNGRVPGQRLIMLGFADDVICFIKGNQS